MLHKNVLNSCEGGTIIYRVALFKQEEANAIGIWCFPKAYSYQYVKSGIFPLLVAFSGHVGIWRALSGDQI